MTLDSILKILHILTAIAMISGVVGREYARRQAHRAADLKIFQELSLLAGRFEDTLVRQGSLLTVLFGVILAVRQDWPIFGFLQGSPINWLLVCNLLLISIILIIIFVFLPRGKVYEELLRDATAKGEITTELSLSFDDPVVRLGHMWELVCLLIIVALMVAKPF